MGQRPAKDLAESLSDAATPGSNGLEDTSTATSSRPSEATRGPVQLFVLVHGICGDKRDWEVWQQRLDARGQRDWEIRVSTSITPGAYFAGYGIDRLAKLLAEDVKSWVEELLEAQAKAVVINFICHSLGGLVARCSLPQVSDYLEGSHASFGQFLTLNTPHLGVRGGNLLMCWKNMSFLIPRQISEQVHQLTLQDSCTDDLQGVMQADTPSFSPSGSSQLVQARQRMLLEQLADPDGRFCKQLARFKHRTVVAATHWDVIVPFCTAAICAANPFRSPNLLKGDSRSFWRVDAAVGFEADSVLGKCQEDAGEVAADWAHSLEDPRAMNENEGLEAACTEGDASARSEESIWSSRFSQDSWLRSSDSQVEFPATMLIGLQRTAPWRRVVYTLHQPWIFSKSPSSDASRWGHGDVHLFSMGRDRKVLEWSIEFIDLLISMFEEPEVGSDSQH